MRQVADDTPMPPPRTAMRQVADDTPMPPPRKRRHQQQQQQQQQQQEEATERRVALERESKALAEAGTVLAEVGACLRASDSVTVRLKEDVSPETKDELKEDLTKDGEGLAKEKEDLAKEKEMLAKRKENLIKEKEALTNEEKEEAFAQHQIAYAQPLTLTLVKHFGDALQLQEPSITKSETKYRPEERVVLLSDTPHLATLSFKAPPLEQSFYTLATEFLPQWVKATNQTPTGVCTLPSLDELQYHVQLPRECQPGLHTKVTTKGCAAFNGKGEGVSTNTFNEACTYTLYGMCDSYFSSAGDTDHVFYGAPPLGFALIFFTGLGYFLVLEMVGHLFISPFSEPFVLGSMQHKEAVDVIPTDKGSAITITYDPCTWTHCPFLQQEIVYSPNVGGNFYKIITVFAYKPSWFESLFKTHHLYEAALQTCACKPPSLVRSTLLFGYFEVAIKMPFLDGHCLTGTTLPDSALSQILCALAWLAAHNLSYTDLKPDNVMKQPGGTFQLVDYEDLEEEETVQDAAKKVWSRLTDKCAPPNFPPWLNTRPDFQMQGTVCPGLSFCTQ
eukprot:TRINITY_DN1028_c0_g1_i5.p1 TRINITY_DN1028_c0_g1~~TRINITY_DN1028_c0_g1_i5.p1  ORF type:complete len:569 (+),score=138.12 TRINITY_DN1028_c0_g1_i5:29-1708(+)